VEAFKDPGDRADQVEQERQLLYLAASRARERLYVSYPGQPSPFLGRPTASRVQQTAKANQIGAAIKARPPA
jgi:superfamily I DNA/RNA helicase